jgi:uncharacterized protein
VNDFAGVLSSEQKSAIENKLALFNASTTNEIVLVTVKSLEGDYIERYAVELFKAWGIGTKKNDNGVLLLIAVDDHTMRIEVGYGLEGALTDAISAQIIRDDLTPAFKQNDFYGGIRSAIDDIIKVTQREYVSGGNSSSVSILESYSVFLFMTFVFLAQFGTFMASVFARSKSWWAGGVVGTMLGGVLAFIFSDLGISIGAVMVVISGLFGFLFDFLVSRSYNSAIASGRSAPWWIGGKGFSGSSSSGGSSFGGFGGGRSGGGGASGSW